MGHGNQHTVPVMGDVLCGGGGMDLLVDHLVSLLPQSIHGELQSPFARRSWARDPIGPHYTKSQLRISTISEFNGAPGDRGTLMYGFVRRADWDLDRKIGLRYDSSSRVPDRRTGDRTRSDLPDSVPWVR